MKKTKKTQQFLEKHSKSTVKSSELIEKLEVQLSTDDEIIVELEKELDDKTVDTQENISKNLKTFRENVRDIEKIYSSFVGKYDLQQLASLSIECLNRKVPWLSVREELCKAAVKEFLKTIELSEAASFLQLLDGTIGSVENFAVNILPLKSKRPPVSSTIDDFYEKMVETIDIGQICDVFTLKIDSFEDFFKIPDVLRQRFEDFKSNLPEYPTFDFPDNLETVDFLFEIEKLTEKQIKEQVSRFVVSLISTVLQEVIQNNCLDDNSSFVISSNVDKRNISNALRDKYGANSEQMSDLVEDISSVLSASELCGLLRGASNDEIIQIINFVVLKKYPTLQPVLSDEESVQDFFVLLSNSIDFGICEEIIQSGGEFGPCLEEEVNRLRDCALKRKNITGSEIDSLLKKIKDNHKETLSKLFDVLSSSQNEQFDFSRICEIDIETELIKNFELTSENIIDSVLKTVGLSYDQALSSYVSRLLKKIDVPSKKDTKILPNLAKNVLSALNEAYNSLFAGNMSKFRSQKGELIKIIEQASGQKGNKWINDYIDLAEADKYAYANSFLKSNAKKVQPELKKKLEIGDFVGNGNGNFVFSLPERDVSEVNTLFKGKKYENVLPKKTEDAFSFQFYGELDENNKIVDYCQAKYTTTEQRQEIGVDLSPVDPDCQIIEVYLPISFGLATYNNLYNVGNQRSQTLFPLYKQIFKEYYPEYNKFLPGSLAPTVDYSKQISKANSIFIQMRKGVAEKLKNKSSDRYWWNALSRLSVEEQDLYYKRYDIHNIRGRINDEIIEKMVFTMERHWLENIWSNLNVSYTYRIYKTGEAYLTKIDLNKRIHTNVDDDELYGGPKVNIEDIISYNVTHAGQKNWVNNILHGSFAKIDPKLSDFNPFLPISELRVPRSAENLSKNSKSSFTKGVIKYEYGIPANAKARQSSWLDKSGKKSEIFKHFVDNDSVLPKYLGEPKLKSDVDPFNAEKIIKFYNNSGYLLNEKDKKYATVMSGFDFEQIPVEFSKKDGKMLIAQSAIPTFSNIEKEYQIKNILNIPGDALETFRNQHSFRMLKKEKNYQIVVRSDDYYSSKTLKKSISEKYLVGAPRKKKNIDSLDTKKWNFSSQDNLIPKFKHLQGKESVWSHVWSNIIIESLQRGLALTESDKKNVRDFYVERNGFERLMEDMVKKFSKHISTSPIFSSVETTKQDKGFTISNEEEKRGLMEANVLEMVNFSPKIPKNNLICDIDVDLLRMSEIKRNVLNKQKKIIACLDEENAIGDMNKALLDAIVQVVIRIYAVEYVLASIFFFSRYNLNPLEVEDVVASFIANTITIEIDKEAARINKKDLKRDFYEIVGSLYLETFKLTDGDVDCVEALKELIKRQISLVSSRLKNVLYTPESITNQKFDIKDVFEKYMTPYVEISKLQSSFEKGRFVATNTSEMTDLQTEDYLRGFVGLDMIKERAKKYDTSKAGFFLEKYVVPKWKDNYKPKDKLLTGIVGLEAFNDQLNNIVESPQDDRLTKYLDTLKVGMRLVYRPNPNSKEHQFLKNIVNRKYKLPNYDTKTFFEPGKREDVPNRYHIKQTIYGELVTRIRQGSDGDPSVKQNIKLELYWKINNKSDRDSIRKMLSQKSWDLSLLTSDNKHKKSIAIFIDNSKEPISFEDFKKSRNINDIQDFIDNFLYFDTEEPGDFFAFRTGTLSQPIASESKTERTVGQSVLLPIYNVENDIDVSTLIEDFTDVEERITKEVQLDNTTDCKNKPVVLERKDILTRIDFVQEYDFCFEDRFESMIFSSEQWKLIVDNIFAINKTANMLSLYVVFYNRITTNVLEMFNAVKRNLFSFVENINNLDNQEYTDSNMLTNLGSEGFFSPSNLVDVDIDSSSFFDMDAIRNSTPYVIMKSLMETFDPNIAPSKKIVDVANNYKKQIISSARPFLEMIDKDNRTPKEEQELAAAEGLISLAQQLENIPDMPIHIPSVFFMVAGLMPTPLGFAYLSFEAILGIDLLKRVEENTKLKQKIEKETGISLNAAREFADVLSKVCE